MNKQEQLRADVSRLQLQLNDIGAQLGANQTQPPTISSPDKSFQPIPVTTSPSAVNQIRNGEASHSNNTWYEAVAAPTADKGKECGIWFSNDAPVAGQVLDFTTGITNPTNKTLKAFVNDGGVHSTYNAAYCDWDRARGIIRLTGDKSLDQPLSSNRVVTPNRPVQYVGALIALLNSTIVIPSDCHVYAGIWDNTNSAPRPDWLQGSAFALSGSVRGTPAATTERRYKVLAFTDRGFTYLSTEVTLGSAPSDAAFATSDVFLSWRVVPGILRYAVYRQDITAAKYRLLRTDIIGGSYVDNGSLVDDDVGGYPSATDTLLKAYTATRDGDLGNVPVDGSPWAVLSLNPAIPRDYDQGTTTAEQVLRLGLTKALDRRMIDAVSVAASTTVQSATGNFTALDTGRLATLYAADGVTVKHGPEAITFVDATHVTFATAVATSNTGAVLYIVGGGDHGLLIDALHMSYVPGAAFAANPEDDRLTKGGQNPIAAPSSSSQGGAGGGGDIDPGGGGIGCVTLDCPIGVMVGHRLESLSWRAILTGEFLFSGDLRPNQVFRKPTARTESLQLVRIRASWLYDIELPCSPKHRVITEPLDSRGRAVEDLRPGDRILSNIDSVVERRSIRKIVNTGQEANVGTFVLGSGHVYSAGRVHYRSWFHLWIARLLRIHPVVGVLSHNEKPIES